MRHAIYFTPEPSSALHKLGSSWLGRDAHSKASLGRPDPRLSEYTSDAARYGFHGTLKPPFVMKSSVPVAMLEAGVRGIAQQHASFSAGILELQLIEGFLALVLAQPSAALHQLADDCVERLDDFRTPPEEAELQKRRALGLTEDQEILLQRWGYPYVLEEFRFHMTLSSRLSNDEQAWMMPLAKAHFASVLAQPLWIDALTIMVEPESGADFVTQMRISLIYHNSKDV